MSDSDATQTQQGDATKQLRAMLDELNVEWKAYDEFELTTQWETHNGAFVYWTRERDGKLLVETTAPTKCSLSATPTQAIAVTLGDNDAIEEALTQIADWHHDHLSEYAEECEMDEYGGMYWVIERDVSDDLDNLIIKAQNLTATLGAGTCHTVAMDCFGNPPYNTTGLNGNNTACGCSECGAPWSTVGLFRGNQLRHNFKACPICGRRVVDE